MVLYRHPNNIIVQQNSQTVSMGMHHLEGRNQIFVNKKSLYSVLPAVSLFLFSTHTNADLHLHLILPLIISLN